MNAPMQTHSTPYPLIVKSLITCLIALLLYIGTDLMALSQSQQSQFSGYFLYTLCLFLLLLNLRKKLAFIALGRVAHWMQLHIYVGWLALCIFLYHTGGSLPNGLLDWALFLFSMATFISGLVGLALNKYLPLRLQHVGPYQHPDTLSDARRSTKASIETALEALGAIVPNSVLQQWYDAELKTWIADPHDQRHHLLGRHTRQQYLVNKLDSCTRLLLSAPRSNEGSGPQCEEERLLQEKNEQVLKHIKMIETALFKKLSLDQKQAYFSLLKYWLFFHIPAAYGMMLLATLHLVTATAFLNRV